MRVRLLALGGELQLFGAVADDRHRNRDAGRFFMKSYCAEGGTLELGRRCNTLIGDGFEGNSKVLA